MKESTLARSLSLFSLGLGFAELLAPRHVARLAGLHDDHDLLIRILGLREISSGLGIMQGKPAYFLWSRVAGDAIDLALLAAAHRSPGNDRRRLNVALAAVAGVTALDVVASLLASRDHTQPRWRVAGDGPYRAGFERHDPVSLRAVCDEVMRSHHGAHGSATTFPAEPPPALAADTLGDAPAAPAEPDTPRIAPR